VEFQAVGLDEFSGMLLRLENVFRASVETGRPVYWN
jgi:hypothetical protein